MSYKTPTNETRQPASANDGSAATPMEVISAVDQASFQHSASKLVELHQRKGGHLTTLQSAMDNKTDKQELKHLQSAHAKSGAPQVRGIDPSYLDDVPSYQPNLDHCVALDPRKEFVRHKRIICAMREFASLDVQNRWDMSYYRAFCERDEPTLRTEGTINPQGNVLSSNITDQLPGE